VTADSPVLRTCVFVEPSPGAWGVVWALDSAAKPFVALGYGAQGASAEGELEAGDEPNDGWIARGESIELVFSPGSESLVTSDGAFDQLCHVSGRLAVGGEDRAVDCAGYRAVRVFEKPLEEVDSIRAVAAILEPDEGVGLAAVRPLRARGHAGDRVTAAILAADGSTSVEDPRLSTTYAEDGRPTRAALELWTKDEQGEDRLRRAAGEALGTHVTGGLGGLRVRAELFAWHSRGRDGTGVYLLAERG